MWEGRGVWGFGGLGDRGLNWLDWGGGHRDGAGAGQASGSPGGTAEQTAHFLAPGWRSGRGAGGGGRTYVGHDVYLQAQE